MTASLEQRPILRVRDLRVEFTNRGGLFEKPSVLRAVDGVSFDLHRGETLGLVGESGCGKSTTARAILRLLRASSGSAEIDLGTATEKPRWNDILQADRGELRGLRQHIQLVFQDPYASLNPRMTVRRIIGEPLMVNDKVHGKSLDDAVKQLMQLVGLVPEQLNRYPTPSPEVSDNVSASPVRWR